MEAWSSEFYFFWMPEDNFEGLQLNDSWHGSDVKGSILEQILSLVPPALNSIEPGGFIVLNSGPRAPAFKSIELGGFINFLSVSNQRILQ